MTCLVITFKQKQIGSVVFEGVVHSEGQIIPKADMLA